MAVTVTRAQAPRRGSPLRGRVRGRVLLLLCVMYALAYFDRVNISTAAPSIEDSLHLSKAQFGLAVSAFAVPYGLMQSAGGWVGDKLGPRKALFIATIGWAAATAATGAVGGLGELIVARAVLGICEGTTFPTATRAMSQWLPVDRHAFGQGVVHSASRLGNAVAPVVVAGMIAWAGWRSSFWLAGAVSIVWAFAWFWYFRDRPDDHPGVDAGELEELVHGTAGRLAPGGRVPWRPLLRRLLPVTFVDFCYGWLLWLYLTWLPTIFKSDFGLDLKNFAEFSSFTLLAGVAGDYLGGWVSDRLLRRTGNVRRARRTNLWIGLGGSVAFLIPAVSVHRLVPVAVSLAIAFFFLELCNSALWAIPMDVCPEHSGFGGGVMNTGFGIAGMIAPPVIGWLLDYTGGYRVPLFISMGLLLAGMAGVFAIDPAPLEPGERGYGEGPDGGGPDGGAGGAAYPEGPARGHLRRVTGGRTRPGTS